MATVDQGSTKTFTAFIDGAVITVTAAGGASGTITDQTGNVYQIGPLAFCRTFGPMKAGDFVSIQMQVGSSLVDSTGGSASALAAKRTGSYGLVALLFGDSLSANGFTALGGTTAQNPVSIASAELGGVFKRIVNGGVSGTRTDAQLAALPGYLAAYSPDIVIFGPNSVNDIDSTKGTVFTSAQTIANYEACISLCLACPSVKEVWLSTVHRASTTPVGAVTVAGNATRRWYDDLDAYVRMKALSDPRIKVIEYCRAACDAAGTSLRTNYNLLSSDLTHIGYLGSRSVGNDACKAPMQQLSFTPWEMPRFNSDYRNLLGPGASSLQGSFASGSGGVTFTTGVTGTSCPGGLIARRQSSDSTATGANVASIASPVGLPGQAAQMDITIGANGGGAGFSRGQSASGRNNYDNARANSQAYTWGERINLSSTLCAQVFTPGTSAASAPDFTGASVGDFITDGTVQWLVTEIPQVGDKLLIEVDMSITAVTGGVSPVAWIQFTDTAGNSTNATWLNYAGNANAVAWPASTGRVLLRNVIDMPVLASGSCRTILLLAGVQGANAATATIQLHGMSIRKY